MNVLNGPAIKIKTDMVGKVFQISCIFRTESHTANFIASRSIQLMVSWSGISVTTLLA